MPAKLISIIGPPAVGKTTLAEDLAADLSAGLIREDYAGNPFLAESYVGVDSARLPSQLHFLISRVGQLARAGWPEDGLFVSDYGFCQDRAYASVRLGTEDYAAYDAVATRLEPLVQPPDAIVLMEASIPALKKRIAARGRDFERAMDPEFLAAMAGMYHGMAPQLPCAVLRVNTETVDLRQPGPRREFIRTLADRMGGLQCA